MKNFLVFSCIAILIALGLTLSLRWSFWSLLIILETFYGLYLLRQTNPKIAWAIATVVVLIIIGSWAKSWFQENMPVSNEGMPYAKNNADTWFAKKSDPGLSKARTVIFRSLRDKEDKFAAEIPSLMQKGDYNEIKKRTQELIDIRKDIDTLLTQTATPAGPSAKSNTVPYKVNKGEIVSTLSIPDNSTVYLESDKAFSILERDSKDDGAEKPSTLTMPQGKSNKYFAWGGTLRVVGLYDNTTVKMHL